MTKRARVGALRTRRLARFWLVGWLVDAEYAQRGVTEDARSVASIALVV